MKSAKLTIRLEVDELEFARTYAREHHISLTALVHRFFSQLRRAQDAGVPAGLEGIAGLVPPDTDAREEHVARLLEKHR